jgi:hypothetical protein
MEIAGLRTLVFYSRDPPLTCRPHSSPNLLLLHLRVATLSSFAFWTQVDLTLYVRLVKLSTSIHSLDAAHF